MKSFAFLSVILLICKIKAMDPKSDPPSNPGSKDGERKVIINPLTNQLFYAGIPGAGPSHTCDRNCEDKMKYCHFPGISNMCKSKMGLFIAIKCPKTCGLCKPCNYYTGACSDNCTDAQPKKCQIFAPTFCKHSSWGNTVQQYCEKSCGVCINCDGLKPVPDCDRECHDDDRQCRDWANEKHYCEPGSQYRQYMLNNCKQSCGVCRHCDGEAPPGATRKPSPTYRPYPTSRRPGVTTRRPHTTPHQDFMCRRDNRVGGSVAEKCLAAHNYYRCLHGVEDLEYDYSLEDSAKAYANTIPDKGSEPGEDRDRDTGENWVVLDSTRYGVEDAVAMWYAEGLGYDYQMHELIQPETSMFTQLIWSDTSRIGCAERRYRSKTYVVVHYYKAGNDERDAFSNIFEPILDVCLSKCDAGFCQGHDNTHECECKDDRYGQRRDTTPYCEGNCVARCPKPRYNRDEWVESCEGKRYCTCVTGGSGTLGARCQ